MDDARIRRLRRMWEDELAGAALYRSLAEADAQRRGIFLALAESEEHHAEHWATVLAEAGVGPLPPPRTPLRVRALGWLAQRFGARVALPFVLRLETSGADRYDSVPEAPASMASAERAHGRVVAALAGGRTGTGIARGEGRHRAGAGGALRASVFGLNDGLVSNLSLVAGVAGGTGNARLVLLAGVAGLLAGSFSMAAGEWVSVRSQRELYEREIEVEREELAEFPEEERAELALIYQAKGIDPDAARALADRLISRPETALDTLAREELGIDPSELGSPWVAAGSSFVAFALGAVVPVVPYMVGSGAVALAWAAGASALTLFGVGALLSVFTGRAPVRSGARLVAIGALAAGVTYGVGRLIGVSV